MLFVFIRVLNPGFLSLLLGNFDAKLSTHNMRVFGRRNIKILLFFIYTKAYNVIDVLK